MKKTVIFVLAVLILLMCCSCGKRNEETGSGSIVPSEGPEDMDKDKLKELDFNCRIIRTDGYVEGRKYPYAVVINSRSDLDKYIRENKDTYSLDNSYQSEGSGISFSEYVSRYDDKFFEDSFLIMAVMEDPSGSFWHTVDRVLLQDGLYRICTTTHVPEVGTDDMAEWHMIIELEKPLKGVVTSSDAEIEVIRKNEYPKCEPRDVDGIKLFNLTEMLGDNEHIVTGLEDAILEYMLDRDVRIPSGEIWICGLWTWQNAGDIWFVLAQSSFEGESMPDLYLIERDAETYRMKVRKTYGADCWHVSFIETGLSADSKDITLRVMYGSSTVTEDCDSIEFSLKDREEKICVPFYISLEELQERLKDSRYSDCISQYYITGMDIDLEPVGAAVLTRQGKEIGLSGDEEGNVFLKW